MSSALDALTGIPAHDIEALRKMNGGQFPRIQALESPVLLIVDMVGAFVYDEYPTGWFATGGPCVDAIVAIRAAAKASGVPVIYTVTMPTQNPALIGQWNRGVAHADVPPFSLEPEAHEIVPKLAPDTDDIILVKPKPSAFYATQLSGILNATGARSVIVTGMTTSGCVRATAVDAFNLNYVPVIPLEGVADRSRISHEVSLFDIGSKYGDVVASASLVEALGGQSTVR